MATLPELLPLYPVWAIDFFGSLAMIIFSVLCLRMARSFYARDAENILSNYLVWFFTSIFAFACSRSVGHMLNHIFHFTGHTHLWTMISPYSGSVNTGTFFVIAAVTLFFHRVQAIMDRMARDRERIEETSREVLKLNRDMEAIVSERTRAEIALRIAHKLRNPAMVIGGLVRLAMKQPAFEGAGRDLLAKLLDQAIRIDEIVKDFEELRKGYQETYFGPVELNALVDDIMDVIRPEAERNGIVILYNRSPVMLSFQGNAHLVKSAVMHVIRNAIEACPAGTTITIETEHGAEGNVIRVEDDGPGIKPAIIEHIFEPFYRTGIGETGLGLPYVQEIVREHKGEIRMESALGKGTRVTIIFPTHISELRK